MFCKECVANNVNVQRSLVVARLENRCLKCSNSCTPALTTVLEHVLNKITTKLRNAESRFAFVSIL